MRLIKEEFVNAVNCYEEMTKAEQQMADALGMTTCEWEPFKFVSNYYDLLSQVCELPEDSVMGTDLDYYCFEKNFGKDGCKIYSSAAGEVEIHNASELYDFIMKSYKK